MTGGHAQIAEMQLAARSLRALAAESPRKHAPAGHDRAARRRSHPRAAVQRPVLDAVIVGGGPAGLSAALVLGRARKRVLVLDTGSPANAASPAVGGLLGHGGVAPAELRQAGREQLAEFPTV